MSNYLYTRDLQKRLEELESLESELQELEQELAEAVDQEEISDLRKQIDEFDFFEELKELRELQEEIGREWDYGEILIPESEWLNYVQYLAAEIGAIGKNDGWIVIDWQATADNLAVDYNTVTFQGEDYYVRYS